MLPCEAEAALLPLNEHCQAQFQLASIAKPSWVSTIIALHNHHHTQPPHHPTGKVSKHHLQSSEEAAIWQVTLLLTHQPNTAQLNLSWAWHSSAPACSQFLLDNTPCHNLLLFINFPRILLWNNLLFSCYLYFNFCLASAANLACLSDHHHNSEHFTYMHLVYLSGYMVLLSLSLQNKVTFLF